jgi:hypothetical protein
VIPDPSQDYDQPEAEEPADPDTFDETEDGAAKGG